MKHSLAVDTDSQAIVGSKNHHKYSADIVDFIPLVKKSARLVKLHNVIADKGYDSEENHDYVRDIVGGVSIIPIRRVTDLPSTNGKYRKQMRKYFPEENYHQRSKVETVNSVQKRKFGEELRSRLWNLRRKEMKVLDIVYNIHRYMTVRFYSVLVGFLQSLNQGKA